MWAFSRGGLASRGCKTREFVIICPKCVLNGRGEWILGTQRNGDWSLGELVSELTKNLSILIRGEIALVRLEIRNAIAQIGAVAGLFILAGLLAFCGYIFFLMTLRSLFVQLLGEWVGELVVMLILFLTAGGIAFVGMRKLDRWKTSGVQPDIDVSAGEPDEKQPRVEEPSNGVR